jgi:hypothetical protein
MDGAVDDASSTLRIQGTMTVGLLRGLMMRLMLKRVLYRMDFEPFVARDRALGAFYHPYAYAAQQGIHYETHSSRTRDSLGSITVTQRAAS